MSKDTSVIVKPKEKVPGFRKNVSEYFGEYAGNSGIHGFNYMGEPGRYLSEKIYWMFLFGVSLFFCVGLINQTWIKWKSSPVLVSFAQSPSPVWSIPFPAVTICPQTKSKQRFFNFTKAYWDNVDGTITKKDLDRLNTISLVCSESFNKEGNKTTSYSSLEFLVQVAPSLRNIALSCTWASESDAPCSKLFVRTLTEEGICYTFNILDRDELFTKAVYLHKNFSNHGKSSEGWSLEKGYPENSRKNTFPRRAIRSGAGGGLSLLLYLYQQDLDYFCQGVQGFKILLHHPATIPLVGTPYFRASLQQVTVVSMKPDLMTTSESLRGYDPYKRQCYFSHERNLLYYKSYTQENCNAECISNYTYIKCGCVAYHMPHMKLMAVCGSGSIECLTEARDEFMTKRIEEGISNQKREDQRSDKAVIDCDCLPGCTTLSYNAELSQSDLDWQRVFRSRGVNPNKYPG
ncbi:hypothetical protein HHI36_015336 [Cryptolaemus montrouzieri]|uniref:Pickpocket protein 28-like n=1 Tax=Cryptolaemus montrouzieri TaxID=559131 RepID=A0ABD2N5Q2_9CUCU